MTTKIIVETDGRDVLVICRNDCGGIVPDVEEIIVHKDETAEFFIYDDRKTIEIVDAK
jgi:hypothetical protein